MLTVVFTSHSGHLEVQLGQTPKFEVVGSVVAAAGRVLARYEKGGWLLGEHQIERIACKGPVYVDLRTSAGAIKSFGPFEEFSLAGGTAFSGVGVVAHYHDLEETWCFVPTRDEGAALVIRPFGEEIYAREMPEGRLAA